MCTSQLSSFEPLHHLFQAVVLHGKVPHGHDEIIGTQAVLLTVTVAHLLLIQSTCLMTYGIERKQS